MDLFLPSSILCSFVYLFVFNNSYKIISPRDTQLPTSDVMSIYLFIVLLLFPIRVWLLPLRSICFLKLIKWR